jgi:hypothetical protein
MDIDQIYQQLNRLAVDENGDDDESEEEESNNEPEEDDDNDEVNKLYTQGQRNSNQSPNKHKDALNHLINSVLTDKQRVALKQGVCFFCKKKGHFYRDCQARKIFVHKRGTGNMGQQQTNYSNKPRPSNKGKGRKTFQNKRKDPNALVYNLEDDNDNNDDPFNEFSNNRKF